MKKKTSKDNLNLTNRKCEPKNGNKDLPIFNPIAGSNYCRSLIEKIKLRHGSIDKKGTENGEPSGPKSFIKNSVRNGPKNVDLLLRNIPNNEQ